MSIGIAIFLSAVLLGIIILFISTKDRWNWKKIILWPITVLVGLSILLGVGYYIYQSISNRPKLQTTFWDISLNSTKGDIKFLKGEPDKQSDDKNWIYSKGGESIIQIGFDNNKILFIIYKGHNLNAPSLLQGIYIGTNYDKIIKKFGLPSYMSISLDELRRTLSYDKYNLVFSFKENQLYAYGIYNPALGPVKYKNEKKDLLKK
jgi:hypothetical protein